MNLNCLLTGLIIEGKDAISFLNGFCTTCTNNLSATKGSPTLFCNGKGRIIASGILFALNKETLLVITELATLDHLQNHLNRYKLLSRVTIAQDNASTIMILSDNASDKPHFRLNDNHILAYKKTTLPLQDTDAPESLDAIIDLFAQARYPLIFKDTSEQFTPHQLGLEQRNWVHFDKGCYLGQEIITRMHHLGKAKQLMQLRSPSPSLIRSPTPGEICLNTDGKKAGFVLYGSAQKVLVCLNISELENQLIIDDDIVL